MRHAPLVLLHGFTGGPDSFDATVRHLRTYRSDRIFAPTLVGHGPQWTHSRAAAASSSPFEGEVAALAGQLQRAGIADENPCTLVGYSLGARLALGLLLTFPALFRRGVLIGVNPGLSDAAARRARQTDDEQRAVSLERDGLDAFLTSWQAQSLFDTQRTLPQETLARQAYLRRANTAAGLAYCLRRTGLAAMPDYSPRLGALTVPVVLVVGQYDAKFQTLATSMHETLPVSELVIIPDAGHNVPLEAPLPLAELLDSLPQDPRT